MVFIYSIPIKFDTEKPENTKYFSYNSIKVRNSKVANDNKSISICIENHFNSHKRNPICTGKRLRNDYTY
jgi:hypothetical protein